MQNATRELLYKRVAGGIANLIHQGTLGPGDRVPSLRRLSQQRRVSISTAVQAYSYLENNGLIEARPQSGYFVRTPKKIVKKLLLTDPPDEPKLVGVHALVSRILQDRRGSNSFPFGTTVPQLDQVPVLQLRRILSSVGRHSPEAIGTYSYPPGHPDLRRQIALRARDLGVDLATEEVIVTHGCIEAINLCLRAVAKPGDVIALESPTYFGLLQIIQSLGMRALEIPTHPRDGMSLAALEYAIEREHVKACVVMPTVSNPIGSTMPDAAKKRLIQLSSRRNIPVIEDGVFGALHFGQAQPHSLKAYDRDGTVMLCSSFSKTFAPGLRIGWVAPGRYYRQVEMLKFVSSGGVADLWQLTVSEFLASGGYDRLLRSLRRHYAHQVDLISQAVYRFFPPGTKIIAPSGGFFVWVTMPEEVDSLRLYDQAIKAGVGTAPGQMFSNSNRYRNCVCLNCGVEWTDQAERALQLVGEFAIQQVSETANKKFKKSHR